MLFIALISPWVGERALYSTYQSFILVTAALYVVHGFMIKENVHYEPDAAAMAD